YFHSDQVGSNNWITDQTGLIHEHLEYFPYGDIWREFNIDFDPGPPPKVPPFLFTGKEFDPETGLTSFGDLYYDSKLTRWINNDPALLKGELRYPHLLSGYLYGQANPVRYVDPNGMWSTKDWPGLFQPVHQMAIEYKLKNQVDISWIRVMQQQQLVV